MYALVWILIFRSLNNEVDILEVDLEFFTTVYYLNGDSTLSNLSFSKLRDTLGLKVRLFCLSTLTASFFTVIFELTYSSCILIFSSIFF